MTEALDNAEAALGRLESIGEDGWCLCVSSSAQSEVEAALRALVTEHRRLLADMHARELHHFEEEQKSARLEVALSRAEETIERVKRVVATSGTLWGDELRINYGALSDAITEYDKQREKK